MSHFRQTVMLVCFSKNVRRLIFFSGFTTACVFVLFLLGNAFDCQKELDDISCHYAIIEDDLKNMEELPTSAEDREITRQIFFHETSCKGELNARQACAVESAARLHPKWNLHLIFSSPVRQSRLRQSTTMNSLLYYRNLKFWRVHINEYVKGTPLHELVASGKLNSSRYKISHTSDVLRFTTLYKYPGVFLDLDMIVVKPIDPLWNNFAGSESDSLVSAGMISFSEDKAGRRMALDVINELAATFDENKDAYNGQGVMTRVLKRRCQKNNTEEMTTFNCKGFSVYDPEIAYSIHWKQAHRFFRLEPENISYNTHMYHLWGRLTQCRPIPAGSLLQRLAQQYCPRVYQDHLSEFGG